MGIVLAVVMNLIIKTLKIDFQRIETEKKAQEIKKEETLGE